MAEQEKNSDAPPVSEQLGSLCHVTPLFKNYQNYCNTFYPLMLHELWEHVYRDFTKGYTSQFIACVTNVVYKPETKLSEIVVLGFITDAERRRGSITDGWLSKLDMASYIKFNFTVLRIFKIIFEMLFTVVPPIVSQTLNYEMNLPQRYSMGPGQKDRIKPCFGLVDSYKVRKRNNRSDTEALYAKRLVDANIKGKRRQLSHVVEMHMTIKRLNLDDGQLNVQKPIIVQGVCRIGPDLRLFRAVDQVGITMMSRQLASGVILWIKPYCLRAPRSTRKIKSDSQIFFHSQVRDLPLFKSVLAPRLEKFYIGNGASEEFADTCGAL